MTYERHRSSENIRQVSQRSEQIPEASMTLLKDSLYALPALTDEKRPRELDMSDITLNRDITLHSIEPPYFLNIKDEDLTNSLNNHEAI